jgi:hypothetical protein
MYILVGSRDAQRGRKLGFVLEGSRDAQNVREVGFLHSM